jgi:hypothetical protein
MALNKIKPMHSTLSAVPDQTHMIRLKAAFSTKVKVSFAPEGVVEGDLCQVSSQLLEVDVLGTTSLQRLARQQT